MSSALTKQSKKKSTKRPRVSDKKAARTSEKKKSTSARKTSAATSKKARAATRRPAKRVDQNPAPEEVQGDALFDQVIKLTGIPASAIRHELKSILERKNIDVKNLTVEQLRMVAASYVREIMSGMLDLSTPRKNEPHH